MVDSKNLRKGLRFLAAQAVAEPCWGNFARPSTDSWMCSCPAA